MKRSLFSDGQAAQVAFWDIENAQYVGAAGASAGIGADTVVFVTPTSLDTWVTIGAAGTAAADTAANSFIPFGQIAVIGLDKNDTIATTQPISVTPVK